MSLCQASMSKVSWAPSSLAGSARRLWEVLANWLATAASQSRHLAQPLQRGCTGKCQPSLVGGGKHRLLHAGQQTGAARRGPDLICRSLDKESGGKTEGAPQNQTRHGSQKSPFEREWGDRGAG